MYLSLCESHFLLFYVALLRYREIKFRLEVLEHPYRALLEVSNHSELPETRSSCGKVTGKYPDRVTF